MVEHKVRYMVDEEEEEEEVKKQHIMSSLCTCCFMCREWMDATFCVASVIPGNAIVFPNPIPMECAGDGKTEEKGM